jgi:D-alanyl-D-alanine dipeptidase
MRVMTVTLQNRPFALLRARHAADAVARAREMADLDGSEEAFLDVREPTDAEMIQWLRRREDHLLGLQDA